MNVAVGILVAVLLIASAPVVRQQIRRAQRVEPERDRIVREAHERARAAALLDSRTLAEAPQADPLPAEVEDHLMHFILDHPDVADGFARLAQAARDEQHNKGEA